MANREFQFNPTLSIRDTAVPPSASRAYVGVGDNAKKIKEIYIGVGSQNRDGSSNGVAKKVVRGYVGDENGKARLFWGGGGSSGNNLIVDVKTDIRGVLSAPLNVGVTTSINGVLSEPLDVGVTTSIRGALSAPLNVSVRASIRNYEGE